MMIIEVIGIQKQEMPEMLTKIGHWKIAKILPGLMNLDFCVKIR